MDYVVVYNMDQENKAHFFYYRENALSFIKFLEDMNKTYSLFIYDGEHFKDVENFTDELDN